MLFVYLRPSSFSFFLSFPKPISGSNAFEFPEEALILFSFNKLRFP